MKRTRRKLKVLDFDIENRPLSYRGLFPTADVTAIAAGWLHEPPSKVQCWLLGRETQLEMLEGFLELYNEADMVTGHYIRRHDLPILSGALMEHGLPVLEDKLASDTKLDLVRRKDLPASQEDLSEMLGVPAPKVHMTQTKWRAGPPPIWVSWTRRCRSTCSTASSTTTTRSASRNSRPK